MMQSNRLSLLRRMRVKAIINHDNREPKKGSLVILNSMDTNKYLEKFGPLRIEYNNLFQQVYVDRNILAKMGTKTVNRRLINEREGVYTAINTAIPKIKGIMDGRLSLGFNTIYDLSLINTIYSVNTANVAPIKQPTMYWDLIMSMVNNTKFNQYKYRTMVMPAEDYSRTIDEDIVGSTTKNFNPLAYLYKLMKYDVDMFLSIGDIDIIITMKTDSLRVNPKECAALLRQNKNTNIASLFRKELFKLMNKRDVEDIDESTAEKIMAGKDTGSIADSIINKYAAGATQEVPQEVQDKITKAVNNAILDKEKKGEEVNPTEVEKEIEKEIKLAKQISKDTTDRSVRQSTSSKRDEILREKQKELTIRGKNVEKILTTRSEGMVVETNDISNKVDTINKNVTNVRFPNINKTYVEQLMDKDILGSVMGLNDKSLPVYVRSIKVEDSSDKANYKETYFVELEDSLRVRHKLTFDVPKVIDGRFLFLGGNTLYINNQQMMLPIVKTAPDTVQLVSNYNKIFVRRYGDKVSLKNEKVKKALGVPNNGVRVIPGKFDTENKGCVTTIDYDDFSKLYKEITVDGARIVFSQKLIREELEKAKVKGVTEKLDRDLLPIGTNTGGRLEFYFIDLKTNNVIRMDLNGKVVEDTKLGLIDFLLSKSPKLEQASRDQNAGKKYMYTRATIMTRQVPIILLLAYFEGLDGIMQRAGVKHYFSDTRPRVDVDETVIEFADGYLVYSKKPFENGMLMNGLLDVPTKNYNYDDFNDKFTYQPLFETMFGRRNIANAFDNFLDNFVDATTLDVLERLNLPTDITGMLLHANALLADNQSSSETDARNYRIRSAEVISALVYKNITKAYEKYKETAHYSNPKKISIKKDTIVKDVLMQQIVENYSELNPVSELQKLHGCTKKGPSGCNLAQAYTEEQRSFHHSMTGLFTISSSPDGNVGVQRVLTMEPPITDPRGFIDNKAMDGRLDEYKDVNLFGVAEMLTTLGVQRDDGIRTAMSTKQSGHITPIKNSAPSLVTNGAEKAVLYHLSKDWAFTASEDGEVMECDDKTGLMIVKYKSGKTEAVNIGTKIARNGAGGFNLSKQLIPNFKKGDKFEKNDVLAQDRDFFSQNEVYGSMFNIGSMQKVALVSSALTFEDSSYITKQVSRDMASEIVMQKQAVVGPNTNVDYMVKVGDRVESGDELLRFERSFDEDALNSLLFNVGEDMKEEIAMSGKDKIKSKYTGTIEDIKIYCTVELEELSPSLRKIVQKYYGQVREKEKLLNKYDESGNKLVKCGMLFSEPSGKVETNNGKLKGAIVNDGVLIEFYIKVHDELGIGDKLVFFSALKSIVGSVIPEGQEAYTLARPEEKIGAVLSCNSLISRGITSCPLMMSSNKLLIEFSRQLKEVYES